MRNQIIPREFKWPEYKGMNGLDNHLPQITRLDYQKAILPLIVTKFVMKGIHQLLLIFYTISQLLKSLQFQLIIASLICKSFFV